MSFTHEEIGYLISLVDQEIEKEISHICQREIAPLEFHDLITEEDHLLMKEIGIKI